MQTYVHGYARRRIIIVGRWHWILGDVRTRGEEAKKGTYALTRVVNRGSNVCAQLAAQPGQNRRNAREIRRGGRKVCNCSMMVI